MMEILQEVRVIDSVSGTDNIADVLIADGKVKSIGKPIIDINSDTTIRDCRGLVLGNGLVDLYSYSGEPGFEERETLLSLLQSAAAGGFTRICVLPNTSPAIDKPAVVAQIHQQAPQDNTSLPQLYLWGAITVDAAGKAMTELSDLAAAGVVGFTDGKPWENLGLVRRVLEYLQPMGKPVAFWPCDRQLSAHGMIREGANALRFGLPPIPVSAETTALLSLLELIADLGTPVHIMRVSTARSVELIAQAKAAGLPVTASTTWMHLLLDTGAVKCYDSNVNLQPPLGNQADVQALRQGIKTGVIDAIAINHAPYTYEEKVQAFADAHPGAIGYELALPLLWHHLVTSGEFTPLELWQALTTQAAKCLHLRSSPITPNQKAELTLFNPHTTWKVEKDSLKSLAHNTPWWGQEIQGRVVQTWV